MTNGEKLKAVLNPRANQIRILGNWVEIEIQKLGINFSCGLDWWNAEYQEPTRKTCNLCGNFGSHNGVCDICNPKYNDLWREKQNCSEIPTSSTTKNDLGVDCISRADVLNHLANIAKVKAKSDAQKSLMGRCMFMVENMPSITPQEPKTGHWKYFQNEKGDWMNVCSNCNSDCGVGYPYNYCPNCGCRMESADMREVVEE